MRLFDPEMEQWTSVVIDEFVPCGKKGPLFARPLSNEIWAPLVEKAMAKFCGSRWLSRLLVTFPRTLGGCCIGREETSYCLGLRWCSVRLWRPA